jgi:hypothetical protein
MRVCSIQTRPPTPAPYDNIISRASAEHGSPAPSGLHQLPVVANARSRGCTAVLREKATCVGQVLAGCAAVCGRRDTSEDSGASMLAMGMEGDEGGTPFCFAVVAGQAGWGSKAAKYTVLHRPLLAIHEDLLDLSSGDAARALASVGMRRDLCLALK